VSCHGNRIVIVVGVFPLELLANLKFQWSVMQIGQDSSVYMLSIILGLVYDIISHLICVCLRIFQSQISPDLMQIFANSKWCFYSFILCDTPKIQGVIFDHSTTLKYKLHDLGKAAYLTK